MSAVTRPSAAAPLTLPSSRTGLTLVAAAALLWGTTGAVAALVVERSALGPVAVAGYRLALGALALLVIAPLTRSALAAARRQPARIGVAGVCFGACHALYFVGVANVGVGVATLLSIGLAPVLTTGRDAVHRRRRPDAGTLAVVLTAVTGLTLVTSGASHGPRPVLGIVASIGSACCYATGTVLAHSLAGRIGTAAVTTLTVGIGAFAVTPFALRSGVAFEPDALTVAGLAYLGLIPTAVAYRMFNAGLRATNATAATVLSLLEPLIAAVLAAALLGEALSPLGLLGGTLLLAAIAGLYLR